MNKSPFAFKGDKVNYLYKKKNYTQKNYFY